jgi:hypothetical protein
MLSYFGRVCGVEYLSSIICSFIETISNPNALKLEGLSGTLEVFPSSATMPLLLLIHCGSLVTTFSIHTEMYRELS